MASVVERVLILAKTYPSPSAQYVETSCVAAISSSGRMLRLYPVPFRMIEEGNKFSKWQWIDVRIEKATKDHRPESHKIFTNTIVIRDKIESKNDWYGRWPWIEKIPNFNDFDSIEACRVKEHISLALLKPKKIIELEIVKARNPDWTDEEKEKLVYEQMQSELFSEPEVKKQVKELRKVPCDFYYRYLCDTSEGEKEYKHKIVDWEAGQLYWNCIKGHGDGWEKPFRDRLEGELGKKDLMFFMGNIHRFQTQWLIISLIYPPKQMQQNENQGQLF